MSDGARGGYEGSFLSRLTARRVVWLSVIFAIVAYLPGVTGDFVFDDAVLIRDNPYAHELGHLGRCFTTDLWDTPARPVKDANTLFYRPLVCASYGLNWTLGFGLPWTFHVVNVLLHAAACALAARTALRWTRSAPASLLALLFFAAHPARSENVVWISGRTDLMMAVALFGASELAVRASRTTDVRLARRTWAFAFGAWVLAVLSKEFAVFWPLFLAMEAAIAAERGREQQKKQLLVAGGLALFGTIVYLSLRAWAMPINPPELGAMQLPLLTRAAYVLLSIGYYAERLIFPWPQTFHFRPVEVVSGAPVLFWPSVLAGAVVTLAVLGWLMAAWRRDKTLALVIAVLMLSSLPIVNVTYTGFRGATQDRFLYLPLFLLVTAAARHARKGIEAWTARSRLSGVLVGAMLALLSAINWIRSMDYASDEALWRHELEVEPDNPHALNALATTLAAAGETEDAIALLRRSLTPAALRFKLLANPTNAYVGLLVLQGPRLADGNVSGLSTLLAHVVDLVRGAKLKTHGRAGDLELRPPVEDEHFRVHVANSAAYLASAGALVASRIGRDDIVRLLSASLDDRSPLDVAGRYNLALALARSGDYSGARRQLAVAAALPSGAAYAQALSGLAATVEAVKEQRLRASSLPDPARSLARGRAFLELGAYLRAARALREAYLLAPDDTAVRLAYLDALVNARLEGDARALAEKIFGPDEAPARLAEAERRLSSRTANAIPPAAHERWWQRPPGVREE